MQKLFFTILLVVTVLVTIRLYRQKEAETAAKAEIEEILFADQNETEDETAVTQPRNTADGNRSSREFEEEHPEITAADEETLLEE